MGREMPPVRGCDESGVGTLPPFWTFNKKPAATGLVTAEEMIKDVEQSD